MTNPSEAGSTPTGVSRRSVLGIGAAAAAAIPVLTPESSAAVSSVGAPEEGGAARVTVRLEVNGKPTTVKVDPRSTLLDTLREDLELTGTKKGCDRGQCGACTVHVDGRRVLSCLTLTATTHGHEVTTIEGLGGQVTLHPMQRAFIDHDGFQCGFCTPGQIMSAVGMIEEDPPRDDDEIRERMSGNICRCSAYPGIVSAIRSAQSEMRR